MYSRSIDSLLTICRLLGKVMMSCFVLALLVLICSCQEEKKSSVDILIVGGSASGVSAAVQAARLGSSVILLEETSWLGGMLTSAGVSAIDGNYNMRASMFGEFIDSLVARYGSFEALRTGWISRYSFEPSVGNSIFQHIVEKEDNIEVLYHSKFKKVERIEDHWLVSFIDKNGVLQNIKTKILIDATELGDVAKACGVTYNIGMDSRRDTGEDIAPENKNGIIQDLTFVATLKDYGEDVTISRPQSYDSTKFACASINPLCITPSEPNRMWPSDKMITYGKLPNNKYMINWPIEGNDYYLDVIELSDAEREQQLKKAKEHTLCFLYFIQKELGFSTLGLADDEYPTDDLMPFIPYHRESRRIDGVVQFKLQNIVNPYNEDLYRTSIAVGDYPVDHHHARYTGDEDLPDLHFYPVPSFGLPIGVMIPKGIDNLIVAEKSISVTNLVNGTTRLQPVVLQIGTASGIIAHLAHTRNTKVANVSVRDVQNQVLDANGYLLPYLDVDKEDDNFRTYQRVGATGILRSEGRTVGWTNETWLHINDKLFAKDMYIGEYYPSIKLPQKDKALTQSDIYQLFVDIADAENKELSNIDKQLLEELKHSKEEITRGEFAVYLDKIFNPFDTKEINIRGEILKQ